MRYSLAVIDLFRLAYSFLLGTVVMAALFWLAIDVGLYGSSSILKNERDVVFLSAMVIVLFLILLAVFIYILINHLKGGKTLITSAARYSELQNSQRRIDKIMDSIAEGIIIASKDGLIKEANRTAAKIFSFEGDLVGHNIEEFMPEHDKAKHREYIDHYLNTGQSSVLGTGPREMMGKNINGKIFPIELSATSIELDDSVSFIAVFRDISRWKDMELQLKESNEQLEKRVEERTREIKLINEDLIKARDNALVSSNAKSDFLSMMSHEVRTPINGVIGMLNLLKECELGELEADYLETASIASHNLLQLLNNVLDMSRIESGHLEVEYIDFNLKSCLEESAKIYCAIATAKDLQFVLEGIKDIPIYANGDPNRIRQVISNILGNALKFTDQGSIVMKVSCIGTGVDDALQLNIIIEDTGIGVPESAIAELGQPFIQASNSSARKYGGSGLGLSLCKKILAAMDGDMEISSVEGQGVSVNITFGLFKASRDVVLAAPSVHIAGKHVMVLCDYAKAFDGFLNILAQKKVYVELVVDEEEFYDKFTSNQDNSPDIVIIDIISESRLTSMDVAEKLVSLVNLNKTKIIVMTSNGIKGDGAKAKQMGVSGYLTKPIHGDDLIRAISAVSNDDLKIHSGLVTKYSISDRGDLSGQGQINILIVEDNQVNQKVIKAMLAKLGYMVDIAENGKVAVEMIDAGKGYSVIFMDCQMPVMDGFTATNAIRALEGESCHVPIIAMTANAFPDSRAKCFESGMDDFLTKPVDIDEVKGAMRKWMSQ